MFEKNASNAFKKHALGIIIFGCLAMYFSCCLTTDAMNIIQPAFEERFGWSYSSISLPFTVGSYILIVLSFVYSTVIIKKGTRGFAVFAFGAMALGSALIGIAYSMGTNAYSLFFAGAMISKLAVIAAQAVTFQLCATWFHSTRGRILGIVTMAAPLNSASSVTLMTLGKDAFGLSTVYIIITVILVLGAILGYIYAISTPEEKGLTPDGLPQADDKRLTPEEIAHPQMSAKDILTKPETWTIMLSFGILNGTIGAVMAFFITRMSQVGVEIPVALTILSVSSLLGIPISYIFGWMDDKFGTVKASTILAFSYVIMLICFYFGSASSMPLIWVAALGMAAITGGTPNLHPSTIMYVFGGREYQNANRYITIGISLISSYGIQLMAGILDRTGSLTGGYLVLIVLAVIATACMILTRKRYNQG